MRFDRYSRRELSGIVGLLLLAACGTRDAGSEPGESSAILSGQVEIEIGEVEGEEAYLFGRVTGIAQDTLGRVFVSDGQANEIRVFDTEGAFLFLLGGTGGGPGELRGPCCLAMGPNGRLWVRESGNARYSSFDVYGSVPKFVRSVRMHHQATGLWAPITFDREGRLVDVGAQTRVSGSTTLVRLHTTLAGSVDSTVRIPDPPASELEVYEVAREVGDQAITLYSYQPFGPRHLVAHGPDGQWAEAVSSTYRIELHSGGGGLQIITGPDQSGPELTEAERRQAQARVDSERERLALGAGDMPYGVPGRKPPLRALYFGQDGRLWAERNVAGDRRSADVYEHSGQLAGRYEWPAHVRTGSVVWVGTTSLVGVTQDSLGVSRVARVGFVGGR